MSANQIVERALKHLADGHVFPDVAEQGVRPPWIVYQFSGGEITVDLSGTLFDYYQARVQIAVWHPTPQGRSSLMQKVLHALIAPDVGAVPLGAPGDVYEHETQLHGSRVDVNLWCKF
ncbi:hypothetical protein AWB80_03573 [Caballeronia pedi]|uniref:DUF3168 domain-containing protein n=1 Tax=Caballeronia pedi TaxID=1777141 RepID=A0A158BHS6_9BURK|nr:DUF3168 domain-containing protein [Caballeronia pedi]SAK69500.1 hypothetical protein AWB80_03573 [Caballeronia pedi]